MIYQIEMEIKRKIEDVARLYTDLDQMSQWEENLDHIEQKKRLLFENGSEAIFYFRQGESLMPMKVYVESNQIPHEITMIYQVKGVWNRCVNTFVDQKDETHWIMQVEFRFENREEPDQAIFENGTRQGMLKFKTFAEVQHEKN